MNLLKNFTRITDSEDQLRHHLLWLLFIRVILYTILLGITYMLHTKEQRLILPPPFIILAYLLAVYTYSIVSAIILQKKGTHLRRFGLIQILSDTFFIAALVYATGCSQSIFTALFILPVIAGGLIMCRTGGLMSAAAATIFYGTLLTAEYLRIVPPYFYESRYFWLQDYQVSMNIFAVHGLTFFLIALISGIIASRLRTTEDALTLSEMRFDRLQLLYKQIFDDIQTGIITVDDEDRITSFNPSASAITGYTASEVQGKKLQEIFPQILVDNRDRQVGDLKTKNDRMIRIGYSCSELHLEAEEMLYDPSASSKVITLQDISRMEEMEKQMRKAEKMAAIGELSASIAHDFRNPLAAISGSTQVLAMELDSIQDTENSNLPGLTRIILRETDRMSRTITDFLHYARPLKPDFQWFNLKKLVKETIELAQQEKDCGCCTIEAEIPWEYDIFADRQQLQIALVHLLKNSCYASGTDCPVTVTVIDHNGIDQVKGNIVIEVRDRGTGFDPALSDTLTDPFVSSRVDTAGLGLAIVNQIAAGHNGSFDIKNNPEGGCTARIILPLPAQAILERS